MNRQIRGGSPAWRTRLALCLLFLAGLAPAAEPPTDPILRIDPGEHTALIGRIATDVSGRWLVTASNDKTARVWDLAGGRLVTTLRPPVGPDNEGKLNAAALSPDGLVVALGGWTQFNNGASSVASDGHTIYLHDRASGRLLRRLGGLPNILIHLAFSADGRYLAASLGGKSGVRVFSVADGRLLAEDRDYGDSSYSVHFSADGRLLATGLDGYLRLYRLEGERLSLITKKPAPGGKQPYSARFSPDGKLVAVGFDDTPAINLLDARDLSVLHVPDTTGANESLGSVAWSRDGAWLYAARKATRMSDARLQRYIRRWAVQGSRTEAPLDLPVTGSTVMDLAALPGGGLAFGGGAPEWGVLGPGNERRIFHDSAVADFRNNHAGFALSPDGSLVRFGFAETGQVSAVFDSRNHALLPTGTEGLVAPLLSASGMDIADWKDSRAPKLNGKPLRLMTYETSRSAALRPSGAGFVLGTDWRLRSFDRNGQQEWEKPVPGAVWAVNVSQNGHWVVAAFGDGTIRWHRTADGTEQLALFPHPDRKRWILWTPSGFYDAAPGAEDLIGWHLNRGKDNAADFFPASRFRNQFYRPDVVSKVLASGTEAEAIRLADAESERKSRAVSVAQLLPPVVEIVSLSDGATASTSTITFKYNARTPADAPVTALRVRINGLAVSLPDAGNQIGKTQGPGAPREITLPIPPQDSEIQLFAENKNGVSTPAVLRVAWGGAKPVPKDDMQYKPKLYVLAVGVSKYANPDYNLGLAAKDATDLAAVFQNQKGKLYGDVQIRLLTDSRATRDDVVDGLEWLKREVTSRDVGVMFLAGHGMNDNTGKYFFMSHNADPAKLLRTGVPQNDIKDTLNALAGKAVFFVDTCHSGNALGTGRTRSMMSSTDAFANELASAENGVVVFTASTGRQLSQEDDGWGNGAFTKALVEGLTGKADFQKTGKITHKGLDYYVTERVKKLTNGTQSPVSITPQGITDFPIAVLR